MGITHVIRAEEWISSTPKHIQLYKAFGWDEPKWYHMPLLRNADKTKISKRKNPVSLNYYQEEGYLKEGILNFLALMGWSFGENKEIFTIEEMIEKARQEVENSIRIAGEDACDQTNIHGLHPELVKLLGRLKYRTSYGQNVLKHSIEVAHMAGMLAADIGADVKIAKRGGLLHDIGKAIDHEMEGNHVELGVQMAKRYKEKREVIHCIEAHHNDVEPSTVEALLVQAGDAISAAKPGARRESVENYIKRLENLEEIANSFDGIEKSFAIQAGREIRVLVKPEVIDEDKMLLTSKAIVKKIQEELEYPGTIKVNLIRETRVVDYAK